MTIQLLDELVANTEDGIVVDASAVRGATPGVLVVNEQNATRFSLSEDAVSIAAGNARIKATITAANWAALSTVDVRAGDVVDLVCHTSSGDGGGGLFDVVDNAGGSYVADGGRIATNGTLALVRRSGNPEEFDQAWYGLDKTATIDITDILEARINALPIGGVYRMPKGRFRVTRPVNITAQGVDIIGAGGLNPDPGNTGTAIYAYFPAAPTGTAATIASVANNTPTGETNAIATLTGLTGIGDVEPGDTIIISGAALEENNGAFTIITVNSGAGSLTIYGYNLREHVTRFQWWVTPTGETNNGSLNWRIVKPMFKCHTRDVVFRNIYFYGRDTVGAIFDCSIGGTAGTPTTEVVNTNNRFPGCHMASAVYGIKIGDFSGYVGDNTATGISWANNHDLYQFDDTFIKLMTHSGIFIPNNTSNSMLHMGRNTVIQECAIGFCGRRASFHFVNPNFYSNDLDYCLTKIAEPSSIIGGSSEGGGRMLDFGLAGYFAASDGAWPLSIIGFRWQSYSLAADGYVIRTSQMGGLTLRGCNFPQCPDRLAIAVNGYAPYANTRQLSLTIEACAFPCLSPNDIVEAKTGAAGEARCWYYSHNNTVYQGVANIATQCPDGVILAKGSLDPDQGAPTQRSYLQCVPRAEIALANGANNNVTNPWRSNCNATGPTAAVVLNGIAAGEDGQILSLRLDYDYDTTVSHLSASATGKKIVTPNTEDLVLYAPGTGGYNTLTLYYDASLDSAAGAWEVRGYISGTEPV